MLAREDFSGVRPKSNSPLGLVTYVETNVNSNPAIAGAGAVPDKSTNLPEHRLWQPVTANWFYAVFDAAVGYSILRYHLAGDVSWAHFPLFILNKATSLAAVIFIACSYLVGRLIRWHNDDPKTKLVVIKL
jgi:hypothetical protein